MKIVLSRGFTVLFVILLSFSPLGILAVNSQVEYEWVFKTPMPTPRYRFGVAEVQGKIYVIGGIATDGITHLTVNEMYDPTTDTWTTKELKPIPLDYIMTSYQGKIYSFTRGKEADGYPVTVEIYDPVLDEWTTKEPTTQTKLNENVNAHAFNGKIYLISGASPEVDFYPPSLPEVYIYDIQTNSWSKGADIPTPVENYTSAILEGKIYIIGGENWEPPSYSYDLVQIYDIASNSWSSGESIPVKVDKSQAIATSGEKTPRRIYVLSGLPEGYIGFNQIYNPETDSWSNGTDLPISHSSPSSMTTEQRSENSVLISTKRPSGAVTVDDYIYAISGRYNLKYVPVGSETSTPIVIEEYRGFNIVKVENKYYVTETWQSAIISPLFSTIEEAKDWVDSGPTTTPRPPIELSPTIIAISLAFILSILGLGILAYYKKYKRRT
jgi:N-acetylneuraminic acid mutarotase